MMAARLQRDIHSRSAHVDPVFGRMMQCMCLGMRKTRGLGMPFGDHLTIAHDHTTNARIRRGDIQALLCLLERSLHAFDVVGDLHWVVAW